MPSFVSDFKSAWEAMGDDIEETEVYELTAIKSVNGKFLLSLKAFLTF
jgi:hypothetical protein